MDMGRLEQVELRDAWRNEATDFTPWLARDENIVLLGKAVGIELQVESTEESVGPFRADILCRDTLTGQWVLIENQLEKTDHTHLGQVITYAAGLDAVTIIWIAARFTEEHRAALDWMNTNTHENIAFIGLEVELWQIGSSPIAPKFNVVCKPNDWTRSVRRQATGERAEHWREYWNAFEEHLQSNNSLLKPRKLGDWSYQNFDIGRPNFLLYGGFWEKKNCFTMGLRISGSMKDVAYDLLEADKVNIEGDLQFTPLWDEDSNSKDRYVFIRIENGTPYEKSQWNSCFETLRSNLEAFDRTFRKRIALLDLDDSNQRIE